MWKNPAGNFVGCAVLLNAPWSASTLTRRPWILPSLRRRDLAVHVVVAGERRRHEVLGAVLHPLHRLAGDDGADDGEHVAGVDADLVAEAAADVGADHPDLVLGQPGDERVQRAVRVRRLRRAVDGELAGDLVHVGDLAARLHGRGVDARVEHVLGDDDVGLGEDGVGLLLAARLPVEDVVVGLAFLVVADDGRVGVERVARVDDRGQRLVVDVDELERVACGVAVLGDDEGDLLALEAHLVGGEDGEGVVRQRGDPRQAERLEHRAGDDGLHLRVRLGGRGVDALDARVRERAAQDGAVQHAGQHDVVDVVALAADEAGVLLAEHAAEADGFRRRAGGRGVGGFGGGHAGAPTTVPVVAAADGWPAAARTARTMFS